MSNKETFLQNFHENLHSIVEDIHNFTLTWIELRSVKNALRKMLKTTRRLTYNS